MGPDLQPVRVAADVRANRGTMNTTSPPARPGARKKARNVVIVIAVVIGAFVIWSLVSGGSSEGFIASVVGEPSCIARRCQLTIEVFRTMYRTLRRQPNVR